MNKRGQGLSITTLILIILGVLILVGLIFGFTMGWNRLLPWLKPSNNVDDVVRQCSVACGLDQAYNFCTMKRTLMAEDTEPIEDTTCYILAKKRSQYGIDLCPDITCDIYDDEAAADAACGEGKVLSYIKDDLSLGSRNCSVLLE